MEQQVNPVISRGIFAIAENRIVEEIRKRRDRPVENVCPRGPPIRVFEDQCEVFEVFEVCAVNPLVSGQESSVIEDQAALE